MELMEVFIWNIHQIKCQWKTFGEGKQRFDRSDKTEINVFECDKLWTPLKF